MSERKKPDLKDLELPNVGKGEDPIWLPPAYSVGEETESSRQAMRLVPVLHSALDARRKEQGRSLMEADDEFEQAANLLVELVARAINETGDLSHVTWLANEFRTWRLRREWLRICSLAFEGSSSEGQGWAMFPTLGSQLAMEVDARAEGLTPAQVTKAAKNAKTAPGFAASLAVACGAFDYKPDEQEKAQRAFAQLL